MFNSLQRRKKVRGHWSERQQGLNKGNVRHYEQTADSFPGNVRVRNNQTLRTGPSWLEMSDISTSILCRKRKDLIAHQEQHASAHLLEFIPYVCTICKCTETSFVELLKTCLCLSQALGTTGRPVCHIHAHYVDMGKPSWRSGATSTTAKCRSCRSNGMGHEERKGDGEIWCLHGGAVEDMTLWRWGSYTLGFGRP